MTALPWTEDTRRGSFESFFAAHGSLSRQEFLAKMKSPCLMTAVSTDSATWMGTLVLKIEKRATSAKIAITSDSDGDLESSAGRIYVGRTPDNDVIVGTPTVSKRHAYFAFREGQWELVDAGSANGTILEGQRLKPNKRERIRRSLVTIEFGPDSRFVFMTPASVYDLFEEIHRARGMKAQAALRLPTEPKGKPVAPDAPEFESLRAASIEEEANTSAVRSVHPTKPLVPPEPAEEPTGAGATQLAQPAESAAPKPRHRSTWPMKRPDLDGDAEALGKSTDKIAVRVGKTPQEIEDINFDYALKAVSSLGALVHKLEGILKVGDQAVLLLGEGSKNTIAECNDALVKMRPLLKAIRMELTVGDRKPVEIFRVEG